MTFEKEISGRRCVKKNREAAWGGLPVCYTGADAAGKLRSGGKSQLYGQDGCSSNWLPSRK